MLDRSSYVRDLTVPSCRRFGFCVHYMYRRIFVLPASCRRQNELLRILPSCIIKFDSRCFLCELVITRIWQINNKQLTTRTTTTNYTTTTINTHKDIINQHYQPTTKTSLLTSWHKTQCTSILLSLSLTITLANLTESGKDSRNALASSGCCNDLTWDRTLDSGTLDFAGKPKRWMTIIAGWYHLNHTWLSRWH